ncbi:hypothetical protein OAT00_03745 [Pelagibacteraceae bacterium]|nr:hypothetical protein [Pelagibacteraceae bacterium]
MKKIIFVCIFILIYSILTFFINKNNYLTSYIKDKFSPETRFLIKKYIFPYKFIEDNQIKLNAHNNQIKKIINAYYNKNEKKKIKLEQLQKKRNLLLSKYILDKNNTSISLLKNKDGYIITKVNYYNIDHYSYFLNNRSENLLIYIQGHSGDTFKKKYFKEIKKKSKDKNFDILILNMSGIGFNKQLSGNLFPGGNKVDLSNHESFSKFNDLSNDKKALSLMLSGNYYLILNALNKKNYLKVNVVGISGGAWYSIFMSALITEISNTVSISGTMPWPFMTFFKNTSDWEYFGKDLLYNLSYEELYYLNTLDEFFKPNRKLNLVYHKNDPCCYSSESATLFKEIFEKKKIPGIAISILDNDFHGIDTNNLLKIIF